jgi:hypothetical protein
MTLMNDRNKERLSFIGLATLALACLVPPLDSALISSVAEMDQEQLPRPPTQDVDEDGPDRRQVPTTTQLPGGNGATCGPAPAACCLLQKLPAEILIMICKCVLEEVKYGKTVPNGWRDLTQLGKTCRCLYHPTQRLLYREITTGNSTTGMGRIELGKLVRYPLKPAKHHLMEDQS